MLGPPYPTPTHSYSYLIANDATMTDVAGRDLA